MKTICFTGGGSSGHVTPNLAIINALSEDKLQLIYIGSKAGIEKNLVTNENIPYYPIQSGKLRRYFSWQNFIDPLKILAGICQSFKILRKKQVDLVFSKGGFVSFPVVFAAYLKKIPVICHESDLVPGLANKLSFPFCEKICVTFAQSANNISYKNKTMITGAPVRKALFKGDKNSIIKKYNLDKTKKTLLITGGGAGSKVINDTVQMILEDLIEHYNIIHITGKDKLNKNFETIPGYIQVEYLQEQMSDAMNLADIVISRAGSNTLYELILLKKNHILIPLSKKASRGDQIDNARYFEKAGLSTVIEEEKLSKETLLEAIKSVETHFSEQQQRLQTYECPNGTDKIVALIHQLLEHK